MIAERALKRVGSSRQSNSGHTSSKNSREWHRPCWADSKIEDLLFRFSRVEVNPALIKGEKRPREPPSASNNIGVCDGVRGSRLYGQSDNHWIIRRIVREHSVGEKATIDG